jgi:hypothetical protein
VTGYLSARLLQLSTVGNLGDPWGKQRALIAVLQTWCLRDRPSRLGRYDLAADREPDHSGVLREQHFLTPSASSAMSYWLTELRWFPFRFGVGGITLAGPVIETLGANPSFLANFAV